MTVDELQTKMETEFRAVREEFKAVREEFKAAIKEEGERTRLHFDIVAEQFKEYTKVLADGTARNTERLENHEKRISSLEGRTS